MKSLICSILLLASSFGLEAQTYPIPQNLGGPTTLVQNPNYGGFKGGLIPYTFADTTAANTALTYLKNYNGAVIATNSPIALWYRDLTNTVWLQLSVSGSPTVNAWLTRGNDLSTQSLPNRLGTKNGDLLNIITSDQIRAIIPAGGIVRSSSAQNKYVMIDTVGKELYYGDATGSTPTWQQTLTAGSTLTGTNTIESTTFPQLWNWTGLTQNGLVLAASTTASISGQTLFSVGLSGANAAAGRTTYAASFQNTHTGTSSTNYALFLNAAGASSNNYALLTSNGDVMLNQTSGTTTFGNAGAVSGIFNVAGSGTGLITFQPQSAAGTYNWNWPTTEGTSGYFLTSGGGGSTAMTWTQNNFLTGLTVGTTTIASGTIGGVIFQGAGNVVQQDATNLFWDDTNNRLGVGTNAPANTFDALSSGTAGRFKSSGYSSSTLIIEDPDGTTYITNGQFKVNTVPFVLNANASYITFQTSGVEKLRIDNTGNIIFGGAATAPDFRFLEGSGGGTNYVGFKANATLAGNTIYTLPTAFPAGTYLLNSTSAGVMGFTDPSTLTGLPYIAITGTSNLTGATTVEMGGQNFTVSDGSTIANIVLSPNAGQIELTLDGTAKTFTAIASSGYFFNTGTVQMNAYGAGAATFDASGNITSVSDERLKNIQGDYEVGLKQVMKINPIVYKWKPESHLETEHSYIGFSAQNILYSLGENAIGRNKDGYLSIQDRGILAALVNSVKELNEKVIEQQKEINKLKKNK